MAPRASWKGFLNLSLVSVPVKAYTASNSGGQIQLNQLCTKCNSRIKQKVVCPVCGDLARDEIVKGYEYAKGQFVVIDLDELDKLRAQDDGKAVKIDAFIRPEDVDPIYFSESSYYLIPDGPAGQKPYALLRRAMVEKELYCVATVVLHKKEQLVILRVMDNVLCMTSLRYANQVKATAAFDDELVETEVSDAEFKLASTLIDETTNDEFDLAAYSDQYTAKLTKLIEAKVNGAEIVESPAAESPNVINLMEALKASVTKAQQARGEAAPLKAGGTRKSKPASAKKAKTAAKSPSREALAGELAKGAKKKKKTASRKTRTG